MHAEDDRPEDDRPENLPAGLLWTAAIYAVVIGAGCVVWWMFF